MSNFSKLALNESIERVTKVAKERDAFNRQMRKNEKAYTGRWHPDPDPRPDQAYRDTVDRRRRRAEEKAQAEFPEHVYVGEDE